MGKDDHTTLAICSKKSQVWVSYSLDESQNGQKQVETLEDPVI